ncbi:MAG: aspartyl protease family protein [Acidimicrobiaceae bacterium]|nr:aspartyl protease family protein [Acidimicrobiaceae bacterium]
MPIFTANVENNRVIIRVSVEDPAQPDKPLQVYDALVDTGATCSMISEQVVSDFEAERVDTDSFGAANGQVTETDVFALDLRVPVSLSDKQVLRRGGVRKVLLMPSPDPAAPPRGYDIILGMDLLVAFAIFMHEGKFTLAI